MGLVHDVDDGGLSSSPLPLLSSPPLVSPPLLSLCRCCRSAAAVTLQLVMRSPMMLIRCLS